MKAPDNLQEYEMPLSPEEQKRIYFDCKDGQAERRARRKYMRELKKRKQKKPIEKSEQNHY